MIVCSSFPEVAPQVARFGPILRGALARGVKINITDVGWNPIRPVFHERSGSREEHEEHEGNHKGKHKGKHERITQTNKIKSHKV